MKFFAITYNITLYRLIFNDLYKLFRAIYNTNLFTLLYIIFGIDLQCNNNKT